MRREKKEQSRTGLREIVLEQVSAVEGGGTYLCF